MLWILKRVARATITILIVSTLTFFLVRLMPGNPIEMMYHYYVNTLRMTHSQALMLVETMFGISLNEPLYSQYVKYMSNLLRGDLGKSMTRPEAVAVIIMSQLPWTTFILSVSICISFVLGILIGTFMSYRGGYLDKVLSASFTAISSTPTYIIGILLIFVFILHLRMFPSGGLYSLGLKPGFTPEFILDVLWHAALPILTYVMVSTGSWALTMRGSTTSVLGADYVTAAEARGLKKRRIMSSYVMRNAILPLFTSLLISIGYMFGGSVFIENIFVYPGMGYTLIWAVNNRDYTLLQGIFTLITFTVVFSNLITDLVYGKLDPRLSQRERK